LTSGPGGRHSGGSANVAGSTVSDETTPDLAGGVELAARICPSTGDAVPRAAISRSFRLEHCQHTLCAVRRPSRNDPPVYLAQRLRRIHNTIFSRPSVPFGPSDALLDER
jgi:hypothetical protein